MFIYGVNGRWNNGTSWYSTPLLAARALISRVCREEASLKKEAFNEKVLADTLKSMKVEDDRHRFLDVFCCKRTLTGLKKGDTV